MTIKSRWKTTETSRRWTKTFLHTTCILDGSVFCSCRWKVSPFIHHVYASPFSPLYCITKNICEIQFESKMLAKASVQLVAQLKLPYEKQNILLLFIRNVTNARRLIVKMSTFIKRTWKRSRGNFSKKRSQLQPSTM